MAKLPRNKFTDRALLLHICHYDPATGIFTWVNPPLHRSKAGKRMGRITTLGYVKIKISEVEYSAGPLAWFYMTGQWPTYDIDHRNRIKTDNRWENLRQANSKENGGNTGLNRRNASGFKGVWWSKTAQKWRATIKSDGITRNLGTYETAEEAAKKYDIEAIRAFGRFANVNFPKSLERDWLFV